MLSPIGGISLEKHFGLRIDSVTLAKFRYACTYVGRSANSQIIQLILKFIANHEKVHGVIPVEKEEK